MGWTDVTANCGCVIEMDLSHDWESGVTSAEDVTIISLCKHHSIAVLEARLKEAEEVIKSGQVLVLRMFEVYDDLQYQAAFSLLYDNQGAYSGKTWTKEQDDFAARAAAFLKGGAE